MYALAVFNNLRLAKAFSDYLSSIDIDNRIGEIPEGVQISVVHAEDLDKARAELEQFIKNPGDKRYRLASWELDTQNRASDGIDEFYAKRSVSYREIIARTGLFTKWVVAICIVVYVATDVFQLHVLQAQLFFFRHVDQLFDLTQFWRWVSPAFLHFHPLHIVFNLMWWWTLGGAIERVQGAARLMLLFFVLAVISNLAQFLVSDKPFGGLSGVVYGLFGYLWFYGRMRPQAMLGLRPSLVVFMLVFLVIGFTGAIGPIANGAHLGGLLAGALLGILLAHQDERNSTGAKP